MKSFLRQDLYNIIDLEGNRVDKTDERCNSIMGDSLNIFESNTSTEKPDYGTEQGGDSYLLFQSQYNSPIEVYLNEDVVIPARTEVTIDVKSLKLENEELKIQVNMLRKEFKNLEATLERCIAQSNDTKDVHSSISNETNKSLDFLSNGYELSSFRREAKKSLFN
ncbi:Hypothetical predicted protein [Paramuricea clavata]|uniref:Uncharacterized protein n=1 Tax=Paramuricea clavata TaxID=317549 RepID=A0A7D9E711_PARCT|nr:Hypothetical predicted protein [Paramuricea clavata]